MGGEMGFNEVLNRAIPQGWQINKLKCFSTNQGWKTIACKRATCNEPTLHPYIRVADMAVEIVCLNNNLNI